MRSQVPNDLESIHQTFLTMDWENGSKLKPQHRRYKNGIDKNPYLEFIY